jgi:hypothetical protein
MRSTRASAGACCSVARRACAGRTTRDPSAVLGPTGPVPTGRVLYPVAPDRLALGGLSRQAEAPCQRHQRLEWIVTRQTQRQHHPQHGEEAPRDTQVLRQRRADHAEREIHCLVGQEGMTELPARRDRFLPGDAEQRQSQQQGRQADRVGRARTARRSAPPARRTATRSTGSRQRRESSSRHPATRSWAAGCAASRDAPATPSPAPSAGHPTRSAVPRCPDRSRTWR